MKNYQDGIDMEEKLEIKCPSPVSKGIDVAQIAQDGSTPHIPQWQMGQYRPRCAFMVPLAAANGQLTSLFVTVENSMFITFIQHQTVLCVTVATSNLHKVQLHLQLFLNSRTIVFLKTTAKTESV